MPTRLASHLVQRGLLSQERADGAVQRHGAQGGALDTALLEAGGVPEDTLLTALGEVSGYRPVNLADFEPNREVASFIPPKVAERLCVVPLSLDGNTLHLACGYPVPKGELDEVAFLLGKQLELWVALEVRVREWIASIYKQTMPPRFAALLATLEASATAVAAAPPAPVAPPAPAPPAPAAPPEEATLEESLTRDMVERLARSVASEPIPLEVVKRPGRADARQQQQPAPAPPADTAPASRFTPRTPEAAPPEPALSEDYKPAFSMAPLRLNNAPPAAKAAPPPTQAAPPPPPVKAAPPPAPAAPPPPAAPPQDVPAVTPSGGTAAAPGPVPVTRFPPRSPPAAPPAPPPPPAPAHTSRIHLPGLAPAPSEPQFLVFSGPGKSAPPPATMPAPRPPPPPPADGVPDWSLVQARAALRDASRDRDRLVDTALRYARRTFDFAAAFAVLRGAAVGWEARGEGVGSDALSLVSVPLDAASVFRTVAVTRGSYAGPVPPDALSRHYLQLFGRAPRTVFLFPVEVRGRLLCVLYGDCGDKPVSQRRLSDFILFCQDLPAAFQELIVFRKQRLAEARPHAAEAEFDIDVDAPGPQAAPSPAVVAGLGWSPFGAATPGREGRAASHAPRLSASALERAPSDFAPLVERLTGPDAAGRARAMAELARSPEASAKVLAQAFPGPSAWARMAVTELPEADELGPIPGALSRLGRPAAAALAPLLDSHDPDVRYLALLTAGSLPFPELVPGVLRGLFDLEPDISSAARVAAAALKRLPRLDAAMRDLRQELTSRDALRRSLAARALGTLHDRDSIDGLINLTGSDDAMCAQAASEALREVTRQTFGANPRQWTAWWAEHRSSRRADWLVAALRHRELDVRLAAIEELSRVLHDTLGYLADAPEHEREAAVRRWEAAAADPARARRFAQL